MANNYTQASFMLELPNEAIDWFVGLVTTIAAYEDGDMVLPENQDAGQQLVPETYELVIRETTEELYLGMEYVREAPDQLWIHGEESTNVDAIAWLIEKTLQHFVLDDVVGFEFCWGCSKPRIGEFGGGAVAITKDGQAWMNSALWLDEKLGELRGTEVTP